MPEHDTGVIRLFPEGYPGVSLDRVGYRRHNKRTQKLIVIRQRHCLWFMIFKVKTDHEEETIN